MVHILHLPVFPEGSPINPDAINEMLFDNETSDDIAHIVLITSDREQAFTWITEFLAANPNIPCDEVTLTHTVEEFKIAELSSMTALRTFPFKSSCDMAAFYLPKKRVAQQAIELAVPN